MKITGHCVVKNEDVWVWYALQSVLPFCDEILVFDTGSTDKTVEVINSINSSKIILEEKGGVDRKGLVKLRKEQIERTTTEWFLIIDGDEIWPEENIKKIIDAAKSSKPETNAVFNRVRNCVGDVYHYTSDLSGRYEIAGKKGNLNIRLIRKQAGLDIQGEYPLEAYTLNGTPVQDLTEDLVYVDTWLLHTSYLKRSSSDKNKTSGSFGRKKVWEKGILMNSNELPKILFEKGPNNLDQLSRRGLFYEIVSSVLDPFIKLKRIIVS